MEAFKIIEFNENIHGSLVKELTLFLHEAYRPLVNKGMKYQASHQPEEVTLNRLKKGKSFFGFLNQEHIATITLVSRDPNEPCDWYHHDHVCFFTQFAVKLKYQNRGFGRKLMDHIENYATELGFHEIALDTSEHAHDLINLYKKRDYRFIEYADWSMTNYRSVIMSKKLEQ